MAIIKSKFNIKNSSSGIDTFYYDNYASQVHLETAIPGLTSTDAQSMFAELNANDIYRGTTPPSSPKIGALWLDETDNASGLLNYVQFDPNGKIVYDNNKFTFFGYGDSTGDPSAGVRVRTLTSYDSLVLQSGSRKNCGYIEYYTNNTDMNRTAWVGFGTAGSDTFGIINEKGKSLMWMYNNYVYMGPIGTSTTWYGIVGRDDSKIGNTSRNMHLHFDNSTSKIRLENNIAGGGVHIKADKTFAIETINYLDTKYPFVITSDTANKITTYALNGTADDSGIGIISFSPHVKPDASYNSAVLRMVTYGANFQDASKSNVASIDNHYGPLQINSRNEYPTYIGGTCLQASNEVWSSVSSNSNRCANILAGHKVTYSGSNYEVKGYGPTAINSSDTASYGYSGLNVLVNSTASFIVTKCEGSWHGSNGFSFGAYWEIDTRFIPKYIKIEGSNYYTDETKWVTLHEESSVTADMLNTFIHFNKASNVNIPLQTIRRFRITLTSGSTYPIQLTNFKIYSTDLAGSYNNALMGARQGTVPPNINNNTSPTVGDVDLTLSQENTPVSKMTDPNGLNDSGIIEVKTSATNNIIQTVTPSYRDPVNAYGYTRTGDILYADSGYSILWSDWYLTATETPFENIPLISPAANFNATTSTSYANPTMKRVGQMVYLNGLVKMPTGTGTIAIGTLPAKYRPARHHLYSVANDAAVYIRLDVLADGTITVFNTAQRNLTWISLDGISFPIGPCAIGTSL